MVKLKKVELEKKVKELEKEYERLNNLVMVYKKHTNKWKKAYFKQKESERLFLMRTVLKLTEEKSSHRTKKFPDLDLPSAPEKVGAWATKIFSRDRKKGPNSLTTSEDAECNLGCTAIETRGLKNSLHHFECNKYEEERPGSVP